VLKITYLEAKLYKSEVIGTEHLLLSLLRDDDNIAAQILNQFTCSTTSCATNSTTSSAAASTLNPRRCPILAGGSVATRRKAKSGRSASKHRCSTTSAATLTKMAIDDKLDPIVGRDKEIERVAQVLSRRKKNNPVLIGEPGVGKTAIAEGLALRIIRKKSHACCITSAWSRLTSQPSWPARNTAVSSRSA
jgi:ATP-dependent Clp protease ATP-binding subunit ClpC